MKRILFIGLIVLAFIGCQNQPEQNDAAQLVKVTIDFQNMLPENFSYLHIPLDSAKVNGGLRVEDIRFWLNPDDFVDGNAVFDLDATPKYFGNPIVEGVYNINIVIQRSGIYYSHGMPELNLNELHKYSRLDYKLVRITDTEDEYVKNAYYELVSSRKK